MNIKINTYNIDGEKKGTADIKTPFRDLKANNDLMHQVINSYLSNSRQALAHTKTRAEVAGTGKKPHRQKGTGSARFGSLRTPIHAGGGVAFGPRKNRNFKKTLTKKIKNKALAISLNEKNESGNIIILDKFDINKPNTKTALNKLSKLPIKKGSLLIALEKKDENIYKSLRNVTAIKIIPVNTINALHILSNDNIIFVGKAYEFISAKEVKNAK